MKTQLLPRVVLFALLLALPATADAPTSPAQYERFDADSATVRDFFTTLEWDRRSVLRNVAFGAASSGCSLLGSLQPTGRLPTVKELLTILDEQPHDVYEFGALVPKMIDALAFADTPADRPYWTSTPAPAAPGVSMVWTVNFSSGQMTAMMADTSTKANARCVR